MPYGRVGLGGGPRCVHQCGGQAETIQPLGVTLAGGETLAVTWVPGETAYTMYVDHVEALCA